MGIVVNSANYIAGGIQGLGVASGGPLHMVAGPNVRELLAGNVGVNFHKSSQTSPILKEARGMG